MKSNFLIFLIFLVLIVIVTYPLIFNISKYIPGTSLEGESYTSLWDSWRIKYSLEQDVSLKHTDLIVHPFGVDLYSSGYLAYSWFGLSHFLSLFTTPVLTYNIQVFLSLFLSSVFTYLLILHLTKSKASAFFGAIIFTFCPYQFARAWKHINLTYNGFLPLLLLNLVLVKEKISRKRKVIFFISLIVLYSFEFHMMYFSTLILAIFLIYTFFYNWKSKWENKYFLKKDLKFIRRVSFLWIVVILLLSFQFFPIIVNRIKLSATTQASMYNPYNRPFDDLFSYSARPLSYFLPSTEHPIFGSFTRKFVGFSLWGESFTEHQLYLGWAPLILAFFAFRKWKRKTKTKTDIQEDKNDFYVGFFILLAIFAWFFSQPPYWKIGPLKIYMPSFFMYKILPMVRAYCRFGIIVMLAVAVLAGYGLKFILEKLKTQKLKVLIAGLFCVLVLFEFWNWPPYKVVDVSKAPKAYHWLKGQTGNFAIAEYPLDVKAPIEIYKFNQMFHHKPIINGTIPGTYPNKVSGSIKDLSRYESAAVLKWMRVKYVLVHRDYYTESGVIKEIEELNKIPHNKGLKFVKSFFSQKCPKDTMCTYSSGQVDAYEVIAQPQPPKIQEE